jgi:signal transduction histidine kinase
MDTQAIKKIFSLYDTVVDYENPKSFQEELDRQCSLVLAPGCVFAMVAWIFYIKADTHLFPDFPIIKWLRLGLTVTAAAILILHFTPFFKKRNYVLLFSLACYFELAAAIIAGLAAPHPAYMGGLAMLVLLMPIIPLKKYHAIAILGVTLIVFFTICFGSGTGFKTGRDLYGLFNLIAALAASLVTIVVLDGIRRVSFDKNRMVQQTNEKLKESSREIFRINEKLTKTNDLKSKLLGIAAHDLKNPLQVIIGYTDLLQEKLHKNQLAMEKLDSIYQSSDNMIHLISRLLKALSIDSGKLVLYKRNVNMVRLAESVIKEYKLQAKKKGQQVYFRAEEECIVLGDESHLKEVMDNLLGNAIKFSPPGKSIWVSVSRQDLLVVFRVRDEGPGFSKTDKEKMFARFQKLSARPTGSESSIGLGLGIVKDLVELHKGKVKVESEPGAGSTFIVEIPCR